MLRGLGRIAINQFAPKSGFLANRLLAQSTKIARDSSGIINEYRAIRNFASSSDYNLEDIEPHGGYERLPPKSPEDAMKITIVDRKGERHLVNCKVGDNVLYLCKVLHDKNEEIFLEGACEASLGCSTCHVVIEEDAMFNKLPPASDDEEDMLDQAACLTSTSRLGCQLKLTKDLDGMTIVLPKFSRNFYVDGHVPEGH